MEEKLHLKNEFTKPECDRFRELCNFTEDERQVFDLRVTGMPSLFYLRVADDPSLMLHQQWIAECVRRGVFFTNHHNHFINAAMTDEDIKLAIDIGADAFEVVAKRHPELR